MLAFFHRRSLVLFYFILSSKALLFAQSVPVVSGGAALFAVTSAAEGPADWDVQLKVIHKLSAPVSDYGNKKSLLRNRHPQSAARQQGSRSLVSPPLTGISFAGNVANSIPNDNHIAVSDSGRILTVVNTNLRVYKEDGTFVTGRSLSSFSGLGLQANVSDPRALYDPVADRFILLFFSGSSSANSKIIIGFSKTNDPAGLWNVYRLPGCPLNDSTWSDYPIITHDEQDVYFTFNHVGDGQGWQNGFRYSAIWQLRKAEGYVGDTLQYNYFHHVQHNGQLVRSICPVQSSAWSGNTGNYFLSVRPTDLTNDSVFLHYISASYSAGNATLSTRLLNTDLPYGLPPDARQDSSSWLATNDARVLSAVLLSNEIRWAQNCIHASDGRAGVYIGRILGAQDVSPQVTGQLLIPDSAELGYPALSACGDNPADRRCLITCSFQPEGGFPGTAAFSMDQFGDISPMTVLRSGDGPVSFFQDSVLRWGDYNGIQARYNQPYHAWVSGSFGKTNGDYGTWIATISLQDTLFTAQPEMLPHKGPTIYPNPARDRFAFRFLNTSLTEVQVRLLTVQGQEVYRVFEHDTRLGLLEMSFQTGFLPAGQYVVEAKQNGQVLSREKLIIQ